MAKKKDYQFPLTSSVEIVAIKGDEVFKKILTYEQALNIKKKKGWCYIIYQVGFSQFK